MSMTQSGLSFHRRPQWPLTEGHRGREDWKHCAHRFFSTPILCDLSVLLQILRRGGGKSDHQKVSSAFCAQGAYANPFDWKLGDLPVPEFIRTIYGMCFFSSA